MLARVRLQLAAWYSAALLAIVCVVIATAYFVTAHALNAEVNDSLQSSASNIVEQIDDPSRPQAPGDLLGSATPPASDNDDAGHGDGDTYEGLEYFSSAGNDVFYLVLASDGTVVLNPLNVTTAGLVDTGAIQEALQQGEAWRTVNHAGTQTRVLLVAPKTDQNAVVEVGRSLSRHQSELDDLLRVLLVTGAGGVVLASIGGFWLAGRALQPTRAAMERQRQFVADASHELRTPLTLIRASAEAIQGGSAGKLDVEDRESLGDIVSESDRMAGLVEELLTLARLEEGRLDLRRERVSGTDLIAAALREAEVLSQGKALELKMEAPEPVELQCDAARIGQVLRILVDNAVRHTPAGGSITIGVRSAAGDAEFWVQDTGPGIAPEHLERIFERFYRADEPRSRQSGGSGLGLSIARRIVEAHGGKIEARSSGGLVGTRIVFRLPLQG